MGETPRHAASLGPDSSLLICCLELFILPVLSVWMTSNFSFTRGLSFNSLNWFLIAQPEIKKSWYKDIKNFTNKLRPSMTQRTTLISRQIMFQGLIATQFSHMCLMTREEKRVIEALRIFTNASQRCLHSIPNSNNSKLPIKESKKSIFSKYTK